MAHELEGMFGASPFEIQQRQRQNINQEAMQYANQDPFQRANAGMYRAGAGLGDAAAGMMGMVNPQVQEAQKREAIMSTIKDANPETLMKAAALAQKAGDTKAAFTLMQMAKKREAEIAQMQREEEKAALATRKQDFQENEMLEVKKQQLALQAEAAKQRSEDNRLSIEQRREAAKESNQLRLEIARMVQASRQQPQAPVPIEVKDANGNVKLYDRSGNLIKDLGVVGAPSASVVKADSAKKKTLGELNTAITELSNATKDGGLIDQSTGSGIGALYDSAVGFVGGSTEGAEAVGKMKPIFDLVLKMVPRFEGPQSDKDTQTYREAAGELANPAVPNARKKAAGKEILRLMKQRRGQFIDKAIEGTEADIPNTPSQKTVIRFDAQGNQIP
jgi:hypothetical protein